MKLLQQAPQQQGPGAGGSGWSGAPSSGLAKAGKPPALALLEMQQEAERLLKQQQQQRAQQRERVSVSSLNYMFLCFHTKSHRRKWKWKITYHLSQWFLNPFPALRHVNGELLHGRAVGGWCWYVGRSWRYGGQGWQWRLLGQHGHVGRGCEEPVRPAWQQQQQHGLEEQSQQSFTQVLETRPNTEKC